MLYLVVRLEIEDDEQLQNVIQQGLTQLLVIHISDEIVDMLAEVLGLRAPHKQML